MYKYIALISLTLISCSKSDESDISTNDNLETNQVGFVNSGNIYFENNTCKCPDAANGDKDIIGGTTYTAVNNSSIKNEITNGNLSQDDLDNFNYYKDKRSPNIYGYSLGAWSAAYLNSIAANEYSLVDFYNKFPDLGSKEAFLTVYGISIEEFYTGFNAFLTKPINEQMEIIPDI